MAGDRFAAGVAFYPFYGYSYIAQFFAAMAAMSLSSVSVDFEML